MLNFKIWGRTSGMAVGFSVDLKKRLFKVKAGSALVFNERFPDYESLDAEYRKQFEALLVHDEFFDFDNRDVSRPYDLRKLEEKVTEEGVAKAKSPRDPRVVQAAKLLTSAKFTKADKAAMAEVLEEPVNIRKLAKTLRIVLDIDATPALCSTGVSKQGGSAHVPFDVIEPRGHQFFAQINLADLRAWDREGALPKKGVVYIFIRDSGEGVALYSDSPPEFAYDWEPASRLKFRPRYMFDDVVSTEQLVEAMPAKVQTKLKSIFKTIEPLKHHYTDRVFGIPIDPESRCITKGDTLLLQFGHGAGWVLIEVPKTAAAKKDLSGTVVRYLST